jgi:hypothetical protein
MSTGAWLGIVFAVGIACFGLGTWLGFDVGQNTPRARSVDYREVDELARHQARREARESKQQRS